MRLVLSLLCSVVSSAAVAYDACPQKFRNYDTLPGKEVWLMNREAYRPLADVLRSEALKVPSLEQTGPEKWSERGNFLKYGTSATVVSVVARSSFSNTPRYLRIRTKTGEEHVVETGNLQDFDFRKCRLEDLLAKHKSVDGNLFQFFEGVPMRMKAGARPVEYSGNWVPAKTLDQIEYYVCTEFVKEVTLPRQAFSCQPVWKQPAMSAMRIFVLDPAELEHVVLD